MTHNGNLTPGTAVRPADADATSLCLLDAFRLTTGGRTIHLAPQLERLVAFLAIHHWPSRYVIADLLWPDLAEESSLAALRTAAWRIHQQAPRVLVSNRRTMALAPHVDVDVNRFVSWAQRIVAGPRVVPDDGLVLPGTGAELLPGWYEDWLDLDRRRLHLLRLHALEAGAAELLRRGRPAMAMLGAIELLRADPLRESAHRLLVAVHLAEDNVSAALDQFDACRRLLRDEIGVPPSDRLLALVSPYRAHQHGPGSGS